MVILEQLETKLKDMLDSEFIGKEELLATESIIGETIGEINNVFGYNDGEPLDEDGIKFILEVIRLKWMIANAVYNK